MRLRIFLFFCLIVLSFMSAVNVSSVVELPQALEPLVNGGFEDWGEGQTTPAGWRLDISRGAKASVAMDETIYRSGKRSVRVANKSGMASHVYGRLAQTVTVEPSTEYILSAWVKGDQVAAGLHFTDWKSYKVDLKSGNFDWYEISTRFTTRRNQTTLDIGLNVVNQAGALWLDNVRLVGAVDTLESARDDVRAALWAPVRVWGDRVDRTLRLYLDTPAGFEGKADVRIVGGDDELLHEQQALHGGTERLQRTWNSGDTRADYLICTVSMTDATGRLVAHGEKRIEKISSGIVLDRVKHVERRFAAFMELLEAVRRTGVPVDYPTVTKTVVESFLPWVREDVDKGELTRANWAAADLLRSLARATAELEAYRTSPANAPAAIRYQTGDLGINGLSFVGDVEMVSPGAAVRQVARRPVFFCGYGHFDAVRRDVERFPDYGINIIQIEIGPWHVLSREEQVDENRIEECLTVLDRAAKSNVMVNLLLSPHYFPEWARTKWPHLTKCSGGFLGFCIDAPESCAVIEKYLRTIIPQLKGQPALHSLCLTNEPVYTQSADCQHTRRKWVDYLQRVHGTADAMNERWRTDYQTFIDVPIPGNAEYDAPQFYDWCRFNQERFAGWHRWMADVIHEMWPDIPVHAKVMARMFSRGAVAEGTDPQMFADLGRISGNDCSNAYPGDGEWAQAWQTQNMYYDLQRSLSRQPIFNSENHLSADRSTHYYPPNHFRTALWQGAIHGQGATTIWVWERTYDLMYDFYGNVMHRPGCAEAVGRTCLDLNRLAPEVTALQESPAPIAILYSMPSLIHAEDYAAQIEHAYVSLNFCGLPIDFIGEKQIAAGKLDQYRLLLLPGATHASDQTVGGIIRFIERGGRALVIGNDALRYDEYNRSRPRTASLKSKAAPDTDVRELRTILRQMLEELNVAPPFALIDAATQKLAWGVEWRIAQHDEQWLINAVNLTKEPLIVQLQRQDGTAASAIDLLSGGPAHAQWELPPLAPVLWRVAD